MGSAVVPAGSFPKHECYCECFMISLIFNKIRATVAFHLISNLV